jgi:sodium transport system permease protein
VSGTWLIFRKETREMVRDKRVLTSALIGPIFLIVVFLFLFGFLESLLARPGAHTLHVVRPLDPDLDKPLPESEAIHVEYVASADEGRRMIRSGAAKIVLEFPEDFRKQLEAQQPLRIRAYYDPSQPLAPIMLALVERTFAEQNRKVVAEILEARGVSPELAEPIRLDREEVQVGQAAAGQMVIGILPYLIVIWAFYGGFSIVADMVAGEKEKNTLETLLITPVKRTQIAMGKFLALCVICLVSSLTSLVGVFLVAALGTPMTATLFPDGLRFTALGAAMMLLALVPMVWMFAALLLAISTMARNIREAQTYLTLVSFLVLMPAIFSQFIGYTAFARSFWISLVPVLNTASVLREALLGRAEFVPILLTVLVSSLIGAIMLWLAVRLFNREEVLGKG